MRNIVCALLMASYLSAAGEDFSNEQIICAIEYMEKELSDLAALEADPASCDAIQKAIGESPAKIAQAKRKALLELINKRNTQTLEQQDFYVQFEDLTFNIFTTIPVVVTESGKTEVAYRIPFEDGTCKLQLLNS